MAHWDLFQEMDMMRREMDQAFRGRGRGHFAPAFLPGLGVGNYPLINLSEDEHNYYVEALIPGVDPKVLELNVMQHNLSLAGTREEKEDKDYTWHRHERGAGKFMRTIDFSATIDTTKVSAEVKNGVLHITLTKAETEKPKKITLHTS